MRDLRVNRNHVPDLDRFGFRPLSDPAQLPQLEQRRPRNVPPTKPTPRPRSSSALSAGVAPASAPAPPQRSVVPQDANEFVRESLQVHNDLRRRHGVDPLRLNNELCKLAQQWGNEIV